MTALSRATLASAGLSCCLSYIYTMQLLSVLFLMVLVLQLLLSAAEQPVTRALLTPATISVIFLDAKY